jgi:uncharacterized protein (TIGR02594 family)
MGSQGEDVAELQEKLGIPVDSDFGPLTKAAVMEFQRMHALEPNGIVDGETRARLLEADAASAAAMRAAAGDGASAAVTGAASDGGAPAAAAGAPAAGAAASAATAAASDDAAASAPKLVDIVGNNVLRAGTRGREVEAVQNALRAAGQTLVADGDYGPITTLAVKRFQASYNLDVDGEVGPATARALDAAASERIAPLTEPAPSVNGIAPWLSRMRAITGTKEIPGARSNPLIIGWRDEIIQRYPVCKPYLEWFANDDTPWCGLATAYVIADAGFRPPDAPLRALNWHEAWTQGGRKLDAPSRGAVLVFKRPGGGHVGLYEGEDRTTYFVRGGNQANMVNVARVEKVRCVGIMWPKDGPEPDGQRIQLAGIGSISTNEA